MDRNLSALIALQDLRRRGMLIERRGDRLFIKVDRSVVPKNLRTALTELRPSVLHLFETYTVREGWTPTAWRDRLSKLADACESTVPNRATELREWAEMIDLLYVQPNPHPPCPPMEPAERERLHDLVRDNVAQQELTDTEREAG